MPFSAYVFWCVGHKNVKFRQGRLALRKTVRVPPVCTPSLKKTSELTSFHISSVSICLSVVLPPFSKIAAMTLSVKFILAIVLLQLSFSEEVCMLTFLSCLYGRNNSPVPCVPNACSVFPVLQMRV